MSIDVYASSSKIPTVSDLASGVRNALAECAERPAVRRLLGDLDIATTVVRIERLDESKSSTRPMRDASPHATLAMPEDHVYGWLSIDALDLGFDFYYQEGDWFEDSPFENVISDLAERAREIGTLNGFSFDDASKLKREWSMRLQAAQPPKTRLVAGLTAAALARLSMGFISSDDGGADYDRCPTDPETFLSWYPEWCESEASQPSRPTYVPSTS